MIETLIAWTKVLSRGSLLLELLTNDKQTAVYRAAALAAAAVGVAAAATAAAPGDSHNSVRDHDRDCFVMIEIMIA